MKRQSDSCKIIELFNAVKRQKQYDSIYQNNDKTVLIYQLQARILIMRVIRNKFPSANSTPFHWSHKHKLFTLLKQSAISAVNETYLTSLALNFLSSDETEKNRIHQSKQISGNPNQLGKGSDTSGGNVTSPTANELRKIVEEMNLENQTDDKGSQLAHDITPMIKMVSNEEALCKVNLRANRETLLKEFDTFLRSNQLPTQNETTIRGSELSKKKLQDGVYLEIFDIMIFHAFYSALQPNANKQLKEEVEEFYGKRPPSIKKIIQDTIDGLHDKDIAEAYRKTVRDHINEWVDDQNTFEHQMSHLKLA